MAVYKSITFDNRKKIAALYAKGMSISDPVLAQRTYQENIRRRGSGPKRKEVKK